MRIVLFSRNEERLSFLQRWSREGLHFPEDSYALTETTANGVPGLLYLDADALLGCNDQRLIAGINRAQEAGWGLVALADDLGDLAIEQFYDAGFSDVLLWPSNEADIIRMLENSLIRYIRVNTNSRSDQEIFSAAGIVPWEFDSASWCFTYVGSNIFNILGYAADHWLNREFSFRLIHPDDRSKVAEFFKRIVSRPGIYEFQNRMLASGGRVVWIKNVISVMNAPYSDRHQIKGVMVDITRDRMLFEEKLKAGERELYELEQHLNRAPIAVLQTDSDLRISSWSPGAEQMFGRSAEEAVGRQWHELGLIHPDDEARVIEDLLPLMNGQVQYQEVRNRNIRGDGTFVHIHWVNSCLRNLDGSLRSLLSMGRDISRQVEAQTRNQENARMEAMQTLSTGIAHDFNNLLTPVLFNAEYIEHDTGLPQEIREMGRDISRNAIRARQIANNLLSINKPLTVSRCRINTMEFLNGIRSHFASMETEKVALRVVTDLAPMFFYADETLLYQAVTNLINNAVQALDSGVGEVRLEIGYPETNQQQVIITVRDNGPGIPPEKLGQIFDPFFTTKTSDRGSGLGLVMVKRIADGHEGFVEVKSDADTGTVFRLVLPLVEETEKSEEKSPGKVQKLSQPVSLSILLVEDEEAIAKVIIAMLARLGHACIHYNDPFKAAEHLASESENYDLMITDQQMPGMTGLELAKVLDDQGITLPVTVLTGTAAKLSEMPVSGNVRAILGKPITMKELGQFFSDF